MSLGEQLRNARMARKETTSQVAAATRLKIQVVEAIEREDFSKIPAAIYGKGFIKMFAEHVGLDPLPLVQEYAARFSGPNRPSLESPVAESVEKASEANPEPVPVETEKEKEKEKGKEKGKEKEKESGRRSRRSNKDFFEPDLFAHAGISTASSSDSMPAPQSDSYGISREPPLSVGAEPEVHAPVVEAPVDVPSSLLEEPSVPDLTPVSTIPATGSIVHVPGERETTDSALHAAPDWGVKHTPISRRPMVDHDLLLRKKPAVATEPVVDEPKEDESGDDQERVGMGRMDFWGLDLSRSPGKLVFLVLGIVIILAFVISAVSKCSRTPDVRQAPPPSDASKELRMAVDPPAPYFD